MTIAEYNQCVDLYSDAAYRFILKNTKDKDVAKDIIQESFEKLWLNYVKVEALKAKSYLFSTAYHLFIDFVRKNKRNTRLQEIPNIQNSEYNQYTDLQEILHNAIEKLPPDQRSVILLRDYEGYSYEEIGQITGLNESQVKVYIYRARVFLKNFIGKPELVA